MSGALLQAVLHRRLALGLVAVLSWLHAMLVDRPGLRPKPCRKPLWRCAPTGMAGEEVERGDLGRLAGHRRLGVLADQHAGLVVVGGEQRVGGVLRVGRRVERDHQHAVRARLPDRRHDRLRVARRDEDGLGAAADHVLDRGDLAGVVAVGLAGRGQQLGALGLRRVRGAFLHLHEERVGLGLGDEADHDVLSVGERCRARGNAQQNPYKSFQNPGNPAKAGYHLRF